MDLFYFDELGKEATWKQVRGSQEFIKHMIDDCGLKRGDQMVIINGSNVEESTDRVSLILKAWQHQKNEPGAIQLINLLNSQASTYLSINPNQEVVADESEA